ncbi:VCBS repeat-containing protein, partial [Undibacterium sp. CY21W]|uniref:FG-GAP repeat domain-containing protein n=1 Tax=Undibacterium sp. CY21W TaxID=2762293 RepID=UPI00164C69B4
MNHPDYFAFSDFENRGYTDILEKRVRGVGSPVIELNGIPPGTMQTEYRYFHNNGNGFTQYAYKLNTGEAFIVLDTGDFDGDGALDLLVTTSGLEAGHAKICLSPLGNSKELGAAGSTIIFTCDPNRPAVGANIPSYFPYVVDVRGDGRSAHYSTNNSDYVTVCIQDKCQRDLTPPLGLEQVQSRTDGSTEYSQNQFARLTQVVDFSGTGKPYDVRWTRVSLADYVRDGVDLIYSPHYENLMPAVVMNHFNLPGTAFGFGAMSSYTYKEYPQPPKNSFYLPYQFDRDTDMGGIATDFNGSGYNGLAFGFLELQWDPSNSYFSYGRAELTLCLSTGRALDCGVRKKYSGPEYVAIRAVGNFIGDGAPAFLADTLSYVPERKPRASGSLVMCRVMGDDTTDGNGTNDANITCTPWSGFNIPTAGTSSEKDNIFFLDLMGTGRTQIVQYHSGKYVGDNWQEDGRWEVFAPIDVAVAGQALDRIHQVTNGVGAVSTVQYVDGMVEGIVSQSG